MSTFSTDYLNQLLNKDINIWLPGLLPLFSYSSILVKPLQIKMFRHLILSQLSATTLRGISKPFILCLLAGLDDENSVFGDVIELLDAYKLKLNNDSHFWQSMFVCIIRNERTWCIALVCKEASCLSASKIKTEKQYYPKRLSSA